MKLLTALVIVYVGYRLGRADLRLHTSFTAVTVLVAAILHVVVQGAQAHDAVSRYASAATMPSMVVVIARALLESAGIWIPVLAIPWGARTTRIAAAAFIASAAVHEILAFYQPLDVHVVNGVPIGPPAPDHLEGLVFALFLAIVPFLGGVLAKRTKRVLQVGH